MADRGLRSAAHRHARRTVDNDDQRFGVERSTLSRAKAALSRRRLRPNLFADARFADGSAEEMLVDLYVISLREKSCASVPFT
jgi:hypothetical protein